MTKKIYLQCLIIKENSAIQYKKDKLPYIHISEVIHKQKNRKSDKQYNIQKNEQTNEKGRIQQYSPTNKQGRSLQYSPTKTLYYMQTTLKS